MRNIVDIADKQERCIRLEVETAKFRLEMERERERENINKVETRNL